MAGETVFLEGSTDQRAGEQIAYTVDTTRYGGTPTSVAATIFEVASREVVGTDVSGTNLSGSASVVSNTITTPKVIAIEPAKIYRLVVTFVAGGNTYAPVLYINGQY